MSFFSGVRKFLEMLNPPEPLPPDRPAPETPPIVVQPGSSSQRKPQSARPTPTEISVDLVQRMGGKKTTLPFPHDQPEAAFQQMLMALMSEPLLYHSIKGVRVYSNRAREVIFEVSMFSNSGAGTYDYTPSFPGSWRPPEHYKQVQRLPM